MADFPQHFNGNKFYNPWPGVDIKGFADVLRWKLPQLIKGKGSDFKKPDFPLVPAAAKKFTNLGGDKVCLVGHTTMLLQIDGVNILTDPIFSERASPFSFAGPKRYTPPAIALAELPHIDLVLLSHDHYDHMDKATIKHLGDKPHYIVPLRAGSHLKTWGIKNFTELDWGQEAQFNSLTVTATPAQHFSGRSLTDRNKTLWCGYAIKGKDLNFYFAGDTAYFPEFENIAQQLGPFDAAAIPIGAYEPRWFMQSVHMNPAEAVKAFKELRAKKFIPTHWGTFHLADEPPTQPLQDLQKAVMAENVKGENVWVLQHGESRSFDSGS